MSTGPTGTQPISIVGAPDGYVPGACNIGPWEIRRRRTFAVLAAAAAAALLAIELATGAPVAARLLVILPAWGAAFSWLQARRRFCAGYAMGGMANLGDGIGTLRRFDDAEARKADLAAVARLARDSFVIAVVVTLATLVIPA